MITNNVIDAIVKIVGVENVLLDEMMSNHTSFKIGGKVPILCEPTNIEELSKLIKYFNDEKIEYTVIGNGSNLLVNDAGYDGVIIKLATKFSKMNIIKNDDNLEIEVLAGARMGHIGAFIYENEGKGFEFATGIPGTIGGAIIMNAGAYGGEMKDVVKSAVVIDKSGNQLELSNEELEFAYRTSVVAKKGYIVASVKIFLQKGDKDKIKEIMDDLATRRKTKQPLEYPSAGSTFKRPVGNYASALIDAAGLRGFSVGGASVSTKHAGFVINTGNATARDVINLTEKIKEVVFEKNGIKLELEVKKLGF